jgi:hypothetical protein
MINSNFGFTPLKEIWLGDCYPVAWYDHLPNEIADPFRQITEWTKEDTGKLQKFLESQGIVVRRPIFESIEDHLNDNDVLLKPPITPRDDYLVLDKTLYSFRCGVGNSLPLNPWRHWLNYYKENLCDVQYGWNRPIDFLQPPSLVRMGQDLYIDKFTHKDTWEKVSQCVDDFSKNYRVQVCETGGHSDAVFCPVAPGVLVTTHYKTDYKEFPGWKIFHIPCQLNNFNFLKRWQIDHDEIGKNQAFNDHIQSKATEWVGNFQETVYEVNMLVINETNVVAMKEYPPLTEWLSQQGIAVHLFDFRTRSFWDGGWHCLTLDIRRDDNKSDLFPDRGENGVYWWTN